MRAVCMWSQPHNSHLKLPKLPKRHTYIVLHMWQYTCASLPTFFFPALPPLSCARITDNSKFTRCLILWTSCCCARCKMQDGSMCARSVRSRGSSTKGNQSMHYSLRYAQDRSRATTCLAYIPLIQAADQLLIEKERGLFGV